MEVGWAQLWVTVASIFFVSGGTMGVLHFQAKALSERLKGMEAEMKQITQILVNQATQGVRLDTMDQRLNAQGKRLDEQIKATNDQIQSMARMVENTISRMNSLLDMRVLEADKRVISSG